MVNIAEIRGAIARGYCTDRNKNKVLDPDLCEDMANEILKMIEDNDKDRGIL